MHHSLIQPSFDQVYIEVLFNAKGKMAYKISPYLQEAFICSLYQLEEI